MHDHEKKGQPLIIKINEKKKKLINMILHNLDQDAKGVIVLLSFKGTSSRTCVQYLDIFLQVLVS